MKVLVVDDSVAVRTRLVALLKEAGQVEVAEAARAEDALAACREARMDLVVLDLHMPGGGGLGIIATLKSLEPPPVIVVLTSQPTAHHARSSFARGADHFFDKARDFARVLEVVARLTPPGSSVRRGKSGPADGGP